MLELFLGVGNHNTIRVTYLLRKRYPDYRTMDFENTRNINQRLRGGAQQNLNMKDSVLP